MEKRQNFAVAGILKKRGKILFLKRAGDEITYPGYWELPSGKVDFGEKLENALKREFREETSIKIIPKKLVYADTYNYKRHGIRFHHLQVFFMVSAKSLVVKISKDHSDFRWFSKKDLLSYKGKLFSDVKKVCLEVLK